MTSEVITQIYQIITELSDSSPLFSCEAAPADTRPVAYSIKSPPTD